MRIGAAGVERCRSKIERRRCGWISQRHDERFVAKLDFCDAGRFVKDDLRTPQAIGRADLQPVVELHQSTRRPGQSIEASAVEIEDRQPLHNPERVGDEGDIMAARRQQILVAEWCRGEVA